MALVHNDFQVATMTTNPQKQRHSNQRFTPRAIIPQITRSYRCESFNSMPKFPDVTGSSVVTQDRDGVSFAVVPTGPFDLLLGVAHKMMNEDRNI